MTFVGIVEDADRLRPDGVTDAVKPGDQDEAAACALALNCRVIPSLWLRSARLRRLERIGNIPPAERRCDVFCVSRISIGA